MSEPGVLRFDWKVKWGRAKVFYGRSLRAFLVVCLVALLVGLCAPFPGMEILHWMLAWFVIILGGGGCATYARCIERYLIGELDRHLGDGSDTQTSNCFVEIHIMVDGFDHGYDRGVLFEHQSSLVFNGFSNSFVLARGSLVPVGQRKRAYSLRSENQESLNWIPVPLRSTKGNVWLGVVPLSEAARDMPESRRQLADMLRAFDNAAAEDHGTLTSFNPPILVLDSQRGVSSSTNRVGKAKLQRVDYE